MMQLTEVSHYRILERLGAGGMGEVYLAEDMKLGRRVAIKILSDEYTTNRDRLQRFEQEASAASALNHPNILTIYEVGNDDGRHFIATEYIDGVTLRRKIAANRLETAEVLDIAVQVASALEEAHSAGIIHRDIKPDNIMVRRNGYVKVLDFGLAKLTESSIDRSPTDGEAATRVLVQTDAGVVLGTSHYMSPEQARGKPVDVRSDIWSLGVVIYEMVAGRTPFEGETSTDVLVAITQKEPAPLARFATDVPPELEWIVTKALRKAPDERYQTIKELLTDLKRLKQKREFDIEFERSIAPGSLSRSGFTPVAAAPTATERALTTAEKSVTQVSSAEYIVGGIKSHKVALAVGAVAVIGLIAALFFYFNRKPAFADKDTVLIADFVNTTGESVFDGTLKQALSVQLGQSPFLSIFPEERVRETLRYMGRPPDDRITREVGVEICQRQGLKALLIGSISTIGSHYVITLDAVNARSGDSIAREQIEADSKEKVLSSLGTAASSIRQKLGESLSSINQYGVAIEQATTSSLEALKAYAMGDEERAKGRARESLVLYQRAVELDPNFAMAHARIGVFFGNSGQLELAKQYVERAYDLRDRVSEPERLYISEKYYSFVVGDIPKTIEVLQAWARLYPNDYVPPNNLALNYLLLGRYDEARIAAQEALRLRPNYPASAQNLSGAYLGLGRIEEAEKITKEMSVVNPTSSDVHFSRYLFAFLRGDRAAMDAEVAWARGKNEEPDIRAIFSETLFYFGQFKKGEEEGKQAVSLFLSQNRKENAARVLVTLGTNQALIGRCDDARRNIKSALDLTRGKVSLVGSALGLAKCKDLSQVQSLLDEALKKFPQDTGIVSLGVPVTHAAIELAKGNSPEAIRLLESVRAYDFGFIVGTTNNYMRGNAYLDLKKGREAADEFQAIIDRPAIDGFDPTRALTHLGLARAAGLTGDVSRSRKAYQDFLALWKDADQDLPPLIEARKEYELLKE